MTRHKTIKFSFLLVLGLLFVFAGDTFAQRKSVSGTEVTGTFQRCFSGKFKGSCSQIKIQALGVGKLKVGFDLVYPYFDGSGELTANTGTASGEAMIEGDTAVFKSGDNGGCSITLKFKRPGVLVITQNETDGECGFGHNVTADGNYKKVSSKKPKFEVY